MNMFTSGNPICDAMAEIQLTGNIIHHAWYQTIVRVTAKKLKPYLLAIVILSDIVFFYRPREVRDEGTGALLRYEKRFKADLLQRNYKQLAAQFGCSEGQARDAVRFLEALGVIKRVFRDVEVAGNIYNNVMFIELNPVRLRELTYPSAEISAEGGSNFTGGVGEIASEGDGNPEEPPLEKAHYTESPAKSSIESSQRVPSVNPTVTDGEMESDMNTQECMFAKIATLCELEHHRAHGFYPDDVDREAARLPAFQLGVECLSEMCSSMSRAECAGNWSRLQAIVKADQTLDYFLQEVVEDLIDAMRAHEIKNIKGYLRKMLDERLSTYLVREPIV